MKVSKHYFNWADPDSQLIFQEETQNFSIEERFNIQADNLIHHFQLSADEMILDYGCGVGKHAICLKKKGYNVVGYDISEHYIVKAKAIMAHEGISLKFHYSNAFFNSFYGCFDFIYTIDFPFYYLDEGKIESFLSEIERLLAKNGRFLFGFPYSRENREQFLPKNRWSKEKNCFRLSDERIDENGKRTEHYIIIDTKNDTLEEWVDQTQYYYVQEIKEFLNRSGFIITGEFENLKKKLPDDATKVHFLLCERS